MSEIMREKAPSSFHLDYHDGLIITGIVCGLLLAPGLMPPRAFAYLDDWSWTRSVEHILAGQGYTPPDWAQMTLVFHVYWGALFSYLLGHSFQTLATATLALGGLGAICFYLLLRRIDFGPLVSTLGVALLVSNPVYLIYSGSFMTDVPFLALWLASCLCYVEGLRWVGETSDCEIGTTYTSMLVPTRRLRLDIFWLGFGSIGATLAFLIRQFGILIPLAVLLWLLAARRLTGAHMLTVAGLPICTLIGYYYWQAGFATPLSASLQQAALAAWVRDPQDGIRRIGYLIYALPLLGLVLPPLKPLRHWQLGMSLALLATGVVYGMQRILIANIQRIEQLPAEPFWVVAPFRLDLTPIWWIGAGFLAWLVLSLGETQSSHLIRVLRHQEMPNLTDFLGVGGLLLVATELVTTLHFYDRYLLPLLPIIIIATLRLLRQSAGRLYRVGIAWCLLLGALGVAWHLDNYSLYTARWEAGYRLIQAGIPYEKLDNGFEWNGYHLYDQALAVLSAQHHTHPEEFAPSKVIDPEYRIQVAERAGYHVIDTVFYYSYLNGMQTQPLYILQRD